MQSALLDCAAGRIPAPVAAMRLLIEAPSNHAAAGAVVQAAEACRRDDTDAARRLAAVAALLTEHSAAYASVKSVLASVAHDGPASPAAFADAFDRAARASPEAGVALYSLGSPRLLRQATEEITAWMRARGLLGRQRRVLDIGCGIGRFEEALAPELSHITGLDVSAQMIAIARERCERLPNVTLAQTSGQDLAAISDDSVDLAFCVDAFPYLVLSGLAGAHVRETARVLRPGGRLLILNYSYRGDEDADRRDLAQAGDAAGLVLVESGARPFACWDGTVHLLEKRASAPGVKREGPGDASDTSAVRASKT